MSADKKNIVIIGLGMSSTALAHSLEKTLPATHRLVVITESDAGKPRQSRQQISGWTITRANLGCLWVQPTTRLRLCGLPLWLVS